MNIFPATIKNIFSLHRNIKPIFSFQHILSQSFSKYISNSRAKRIPLNTKRAGKGYKKGYGARKEGRLDNLGKYLILFV